MMTSTPTTKTKALCVATRCTSIDQFVATFHRFCGDDETFFVATPTSRPIGLETPFSIQLADKQPVLRGLCIVLDAWATPENRYRRPGIRLGIKRLTADSQIVFDRLKAARSPAAVTEAASPPGTVPQPPLASGTPPTGGARRTLTPPALPPLPGPRAVGGAAPVPPREPGRPMVVFVPPREQGPASVPKLSREPGAAPAPSLARELTPPPAVAARPAIPSVPSPPPAEARPALPGMPPPAEAKPAKPSVPPPPSAEAKPAKPSVPPPASAEAKPANPSVPPPASAEAKPARPSVPPPSAETKPAIPPPAAQAQPEAPAGEASRPAAPAAPAPIAVTRFQVALHVDTVPPPITDVEFKPQQLVPRKRVEPIVVSQAPPVVASSNDALPAVIMDHHGPEVLAYAAMPSAAPGMAAALADLRTPGSDLVLPANPLQDLTDESLEGFVDCTIYEDTTLFPSGADSSEWGAPAAERPAAAPSTTPRRISVPAMPFDETPNLTVRALGDTESLAVAPDDPALTRAVSGELRNDTRGSGPRAVSGELRSDARGSGPRAASGELKVEMRSGPEVVVSGELWNGARGPAPASGELWSDARGSGPEAVSPRTQPRPETPLPRAASNEPLEPLGAGPDPASWFDSVSLPYGGAAPAWPQPPGDPGFAPGMPMAPGFAPAMPVDPAFAPGMPMGLPGQELPFAANGPMVPVPAMPVSGPVDRPSGALAYPFADSAQYPRYSAADLVGLPGSPGVRARPEWQRWFLIVGSVIIAIAVAFVIARLVRGPARAMPPAPSHATDSPSRPPPARSAVASPAPARAAPPASARAAPPVPSASPPPAGAAAGSVEPDPGDVAADLTTGAADAADAPSDDEGEAVTGGPRVVGSGPCRFTVATTPAGSAVRFDDQAMGPSPITIQGSCDRHKVDASHARYQSVAKWVTLTADKPQQLDVSLPRPIHAVTVTSFPPGAELTIDGRRAGTTPAVVQMTGFATVNLTFTKPGFRTVTRKVYSRLTPDRVFVKLMK